MIGENIEIVRNNIRKACERVGRDSSDVTLIAVSKTMPYEMIEEAYMFGQRHFGENKPQELRDKNCMSDKKDIQWHMIGNLQKNKIKYVVGTACMIHSIDTYDLAREVSDYALLHGEVCDVLLEVNIANEATKNGFTEKELMTQLVGLSNLKGIRIKGLMCVAPITDNAESNRGYFRHMKEMLVDINSQNIDNVFMDHLSMGMTDDYEVAVEEGATLVRVGTGIFGRRNYNI